MAILNNSNAISSGGYDINNSLRLRSSASAYLNRTPGSATSRTIWTWSAWVKRGTLGVEQQLFASTVANNDNQWFNLQFSSGNLIRVQVYSGDVLATTAVYRDPSAWYHVVLAVDTTQATAANRLKLYINGVQVTAFGTATYPAQNFQYAINLNQQHNIGSNLPYSGGYFDGYLADVNFIDGSQKAASDFGETDTTTGSWKPKAYTGTYGTNGFYLKFSDIATTSGSNAGLGKDFSGNANYWTTNNINVTTPAGTNTSYDAMIDSPTLTSATVANYSVLNPLDTGSNITLSAANLQTSQGAAAGISKGTIGISSGKWYWEVTLLSGTTAVGIADITSSRTQNYVGQTSTSYGYYSGNGNKYNNATGVAYGASYTTNDIIGVALDMDAGTLTFYKNNTSQGTAYSSLSGTFTPAIGNDQSNTTAFNAGQRPFTYTPPTGFVRLNTYNLPDSTIKKGNNSFGVLTYTGNGSPSVTRSDTSLVNFTPDFVWIKERSGTDYHNLFDINRVVSGDYRRIYSNDTTAEESSTYFGTTNLNSFVNGGFTTGDGGNTNTNNDTYVAWCWDANGSPVSNTSGTITSNVSVNATAGFSVVTFTTPSSGNITVGHGLGVAPSMVIVKARTGTNGWPIYHKSLGANNYIQLNTTGATAVDTTTWNNTSPTSNVFSMGGISSWWPASTTFVAYCWAEIAGFSKFGSYTGNGSTDGSFIFTGFRPKFIMVKRTDAVEGWQMFDTSINTYNSANILLEANLSNAEANSSGNAIDILSNGFKQRNTRAATNASGGTYIYMAFAENPFKNANAR
jgi:hypothetical protein